MRIFRKQHMHVNVYVYVHVPKGGSQVCRGRKCIGNSRKVLTDGKKGKWGVVVQPAVGLQSYSKTLYHD